MNLNNKQKAKIAQSAAVIAFAIASLAAAAHFTKSGSGGTEAVLLEEQTEAETETEERNQTEAMLAVTNEMAEKYAEADEEEETETEEEAESGADNIAWFEALLAEEDLLDNSYVEAALKKTIRMVNADGEPELDGSYSDKYYDDEGNLCYISEIGDSGYWAHLYDSAGKPLAAVIYDSNGNNGVIGKSWAYKYDSEGRMLKCIEHDSNGEITSGRISVYDGSGNVIKEAEYGDGASTYPSIVGYVSTYDSNGNTLTKREYGKDGEIVSGNGYSYEYSYDSADNLTKKLKRKSDGSIDWWEEYSYDDKGNLSNLVRYTGKGSVSSSHEYTYDGFGNLIKKAQYGSNGGVGNWTEYSYDSDMRLIEEIEHGGAGDIIGKYEYVYDEEGNLENKISYDARGNKKENHYYTSTDTIPTGTYDEDGRLISYYLISDSGYGVCFYKTEYKYDSSGELIEIHKIQDWSAYGIIEGYEDYMEDKDYYIYVDYEYYN